jgi:DNA polymerase-3 subunit gamma/tau
MYAASQEGRFKVYIVDEAHMLTREAWNALLKILEEPPPGVVFVFATTEPQKIAAAAAPVLSRLQRFDFRRIGPAAIRERLRQVLDAERIDADDDALTLIARHADGGMRDALSVLDQCLSVGEGAVTAERVRDVLGLVGDDLYSEVLRLVAERRPAEVFPLIDRLSNAGADLAEFMSGAGETLRALLMLQLGQEPEGLTEAMRASLGEFRDRLEPGDVLRMLRLLTESETSIRRSVNPRLVVETLLLRWAMLDRIVDLTQVLASHPGSGGSGPQEKTSLPADRGGRGPAVRPSPLSQSSASAVAPVQPSRSGEAAGLENLRHSWQAIAAEVRARSRFLGEALANTTPVALDPSWLTVSLTDPNPLFTERLQAQAGIVEEVLQRVTGRSLRLRIAAAAPGDAPAPPARALSEASIKADRLRGFRAKDPALDAAADALDLEIVD